MAKFRFEDLDIWKMAIEIGEIVFEIANELEERKLFRFCDQLRGVGMSVSNNIAEGSGSTSNKEFIHFLNIARRSIFETANIIIILTNRKIVEEKLKDELLDKLDLLSRKITSFQKSLK